MGETWGDLRETWSSLHFLEDTGITNAFVLKNYIFLTKIMRNTSLSTLKTMALGLHILMKNDSTYKPNNSHLIKTKHKFVFFKSFEAVIWDNPK